MPLYYAVCDALSCKMPSSKDVSFDSDKWHVMVLRKSDRKNDNVYLCFNHRNPKAREKALNALAGFTVEKSDSRVSDLMISG